MLTQGVEATLADSTRAAHPSAPIPVQGAALGAHLRVVLGDTGLKVFPLMLGGSEFGWNIDQAHAHDILDRYRHWGGNALHTSDGYASGRSEHIIGRWLETRGARDEMTIAVRIGSHPDHPGLGSVNLVRAVESSLHRLGTDRIDLLYLDGTDQRAPLEDALATAEWLIETGKVRAIGAYAFAPERLIEARILSSAGYPRIEAIDVPYNLIRREEYEGNMKLVATAQQLAVTPSHALEHGFLSGAHRNRARLDSQGARGQQIRGVLNRRGVKVLRALDRIGAELGVPNAAVAIAWLRAQRPIVAPIVNVYAQSHVDELVQGIGVSLGRSHLGDLARAAL